VRIFYLPIEAYQERYTELLMGWTTEALMGMCSRAPDRKLVVIEGGGRPKDGIQIGRVLDAHGRSIWCLTQTIRLLEMLQQEPATRDDILYIDDMFHPGYEALPYLFEQVGRENWPAVYVRNHAQSVDQHDFTFPMRRWMRHYEQMVCRTATGVICASQCHREAMQIANWHAPIHVLGLPFNRDSVRAIAGETQDREHRPARVMWASRWDSEKQPNIFLEMVERLSPQIEFVACTGSRELRGTDIEAVRWAERLERRGWLRIVRGATKKEYYGELAQCRAHFLSSLQDYVSYCLLDASALDVVSIAPAYKSFAEVLEADHDRLYIPWNLFDAETKLRAAVLQPLAFESADIGRPADFHHGTLDRIVDLFEGYDISDDE